MIVTYPGNKKYILPFIFSVSLTTACHITLVFQKCYFVRIHLSPGFQGVGDAFL